MDVFVARQPIFDIQKNLFAYELLFRTGMSNGFPDIDGNTATTSLLSSSFFTVGIDKIAAGKIAFINFTEDLIKRGTPHLFPKEKLMVEILEDVTPDAEVIEQCKRLKEDGYALALDDFVYSKKFEELLLLCDIIKIDFRLTPIADVKVMVEALKKYNCKLLAEKIETYEEFNEAISLGFEYFQGYFFAKPEVIQNKDLSPSQITLMKLISQVNSQDFDISSLEQIVSHDISVTYKLINYLNSSHFSRVEPLTSVRQAISFLGENGFKLFVSLIATSKLAENKPEELVRHSIIRAKFLELIGLELKMDSNELFLLGLFSLIDAMLDRQFGEIFAELPLSGKLTEALLDRKGDMYTFLRLVETYESGNWVAFKFARKKIGIDSEKLVECYIEAIHWAESFTQAEDNPPE